MSFGRISTKATTRRHDFLIRSLIAKIVRVPRQFLATSLIGNGYALIANAGLTSALGLVFWLLAARLHTAEELGRGAALITTLTVLGNVAQFSFGNVLNRFLPNSGSYATRLILLAYGIGATSALFFAIFFLLLIKSFFPPLSFLIEDWWIAAWFLLSTVVWTLFLLEDSVLAGLRQTVWVPITNTIYALTKIIILVALAGTAIAEFGPFAAWTMPVFAIVAGVNFLVIRKVVKKSAAHAPGNVFSFDKMARFFGWDYVGTLAMMAAIGLAPLLILNVSGAAANANYHIAWTIAYSLYLIGRSMSISLLVEGSASQKRLPQLAADALLHTMLLMIIGVVVVVALAPVIMALFGPSYAAEATPVLRVLALACLPWGVTTIYLASARARGNMAAVATVQVTTFLLVIGLSWLLLERHGILGMGLAWLIAHSLVMVGIGLESIGKGGSDRVVGWLLDLSSSAARLVSQISQFFSSAKQLPSDQELLAVKELLKQVDDPKASTWRPLKALPTRGSVLVYFIGDEKNEQSADFTAPEGTQGLLKKGITWEGCDSLRRQRDSLALLRSDARLKNRPFSIPEIIAFCDTPEAVWSVERFISGQDGRTVTSQPAIRPAALTSAAQAIRYIHSRSASATLVDAAWVEKWIERPAAQLEAVVLTLMTRQQRQHAIKAFTQRQKTYWLGRQVQLGWYHGDFSPGNVLFDISGAADGGEPTVRVEGIIDWDRAGIDGPVGFDVCQLALTMRRVLGGQQIGDIVRGLYSSRRWDDDELIWFSGGNQSDGAGGDWTHEPDALEAMVGLVWLRLVTSNMEKCEPYTHNRLWAANNVERVLQIFLPRGSPKRW